MEEEGYYYYDDYYGDDETEGEAWEVALENTYAEAKSVMNTMPEQCAAGLHAVRRDDPVGGKWTFKALRMLARLFRCTKAYNEMLDYYKMVATFSHRDVSKTEVQRAMTKFIDETQSVPVEYFKCALQITIDVTSKDMGSLSNLWFNAKLKHARVLLEEKFLDAVLGEMESVLAWCKEGDKLSVDRSAQLFLSYALILEVYSKQNNFRRMFETFFLAISLANTITSSSVLGSVLECGGKLYMHLHDWSSAFCAFSGAFWNYNEAGDTRKIECLKCLVLTRLLGGSTIDPFATHETKAYEDAAEIAPVVKLMKAFFSSDVRTFLEVMDSNKEMFEADPVVPPCLDLALEQLRLQALVAYAAPYQRLCMRRLEDVLLLDSVEVGRLCVRAIVEGKLDALVDDENCVIVMRNKQLLRQEAEQLQALTRWSTVLCELNEDTRRQVERMS